MTILFGTGFETGSMEMVPTINRTGYISIESTTVKTGGYSIKGANGGEFGVSLAAGTTEVYMAVWVIPGVASLIRFVVGGSNIELRYDGNHWDYYFSGTKVTDGTQSTDSDAWQHVQIYYKVDNSAGRFVSKIDGLLDVDYTGDTQPSSTTEISKVALRGNNGYFDNFVISTDWPGDIRFDVLLPDGDTATKQWTPSTGSANYALVDERPPVNTDYVTVSGTGLQDLYTLGAWDATGKVPSFVVQWTRANKSPAETQRLKNLLKSSSTLTTSTAHELLSDWSYAMDIYETDPHTGSAWTDSALDALQIGMESVI